MSASPNQPVYFLPVTYTPFSASPPDRAVFGPGLAIVGPGNAMYYGALPIPDDCPMRICPYVPFGRIATATAEAIAYGIEYGGDANENGTLDYDTRAGHRANLAWSPDGERSFLPVDVNLAGRSVVVDTSDLPPSKGNGVLRLLVSDRLNTRRTQVRKLTLRR